jgi:flagellar biosynthesis protein
VSGGDDSKKPAEKPSVAVALRYEPESEFAPRVVASGKGTIAEQILAIAYAHGVKVREDADLAELLIAVDIESEIPVEAFVAVAEILVYVYRANGNWPSFLQDGPTPSSGAPAP